MSLDEIPDPSQSKFWYMYLLWHEVYGMWCVGRRSNGGLLILPLYMAFDLIKAGEVPCSLQQTLNEFLYTTA